MDSQLEHDCNFTAVGVDDIAEALYSLSLCLPEHHAEIGQVEDTLYRIEDLLNGLPRQLNEHQEFVYRVRDDLMLLLTTIRGSLLTMRAFINVFGLSGRRLTWEDMREHMRNETGHSINTRFAMFIEFIMLIRERLRFRVDPERLQSLRSFVFLVHSRQSPNGAPPILPAGVIVPPDARHWAENIFATPSRLPTTPLRRTHRRSECWGPWRSLHTDRDVVLPLRSRVLFKLHFNHGFSIKLCWLPNSVPNLICKDLVRHPYLQSCFPVGELRIKRIGRSCLQLQRWSVSRRRACPWAVLYFDVWEKMALFWCTFMGLKWRCTSMIDESSYELGLEELQFRAMILDDRYRHTLSVYRDKSCRGVRLEAKAYDGSLRRCPIWTAFVTHTCESSRWLYRRGRKVFIREIHIYVFSTDYRSRHQRSGSRGEFMLEFYHREAARNFERIFGPPSASTSPAASVASR